MLDLKEALKRSTRPFVDGLATAVLIWRIPFLFMNSWKLSDVNALPLSETICFGNPYLANTVRMT